MNGFDLFVLALGGVMAAFGLVKGLVRLLIGLAALVAAIVVAGLFHRSLAAHLAWSGWPEGVLGLFAYALLLVLVLVAGALAGRLGRRFVRVAMLGWADRLAGAALGVAGAALVAGMLAVPLVAHAPRGGRLLEASQLAPWVVVVADTATTLVPDALSRRYGERVEELRRRWEGGLGG